MLGPLDERGNGRRVPDPAEGNEDRRLLPGLGGRQGLEEERDAVAVPMTPGHYRRRHPDTTGRVTKVPTDDPEMHRVGRATDAQDRFSTPSVDRVAQEPFERGEPGHRVDATERDRGGATHRGVRVLGPTPERGDRARVAEVHERERGLGTNFRVRVVERRFEHGATLGPADRSERFHGGRTNPRVRVVERGRERRARPSVLQHPERDRRRLPDPGYRVAQREQEGPDVLHRAVADALPDRGGSRRWGRRIGGGRGGPGNRVLAGRATGARWHYRSTESEINNSRRATSFRVATAKAPPGNGTPPVRAPAPLPSAPGAGRGRPRAGRAGSRPSGRGSRGRPRRRTARSPRGAPPAGRGRGTNGSGGRERRTARPRPALGSPRPPGAGVPPRPSR